MKRITEFEYLNALDLISEYRKQIIKEVQDSVGGLNVVPEQYDIIQIEKSYSPQGSHVVGNKYTVKKSTQVGKNIIVSTFDGSIIKSNKYVWSICGRENMPKTPSDFINPDISSIPNDPIEDLRLSVRAYNGLRNRLKARTTHDILDLSRADLATARCIGNGTVNEIVATIFTKYKYLIK